MPDRKNLILLKSLIRSGIAMTLALFAAALIFDLPSLFEVQSEPLNSPAACTSFTQGFDNIAALPGAGWNIINRSTPVGTQTWFQGNNVDTFAAQAGSPDSYIAVNFESGAGMATLSNWLITPEITIQNGDVVTFYSRTFNNQFPDRLELRMSTSGASTNVGTTETSVGDFTTNLLTINPNLDLAGYPNEWTLFTVNISGVPAPMNGRLAFRYYVTDGGPLGINSNYIGLDTLSYTCGSAPTPTPTPTPTPGPGAVGFESDVAPRNTGDGLLLANDLPLIRQFVVRTLTPDPDSNEFQRVDSAPFATLGDGVINSADMVQARRYIVGLDPAKPAGGPVNGAVGTLKALATGSFKLSKLVNTRAMRARSAAGTVGRSVAIEVEMDAEGDEIASSFSLNFDPTKLANPRVTPGKSFQKDAILTANTSEIGRVTVLVDSRNAFAKGKVSIVTVLFDIAATAPSGETPIVFSKTSISDSAARQLSAIYTNGSVTISNQAAPEFPILGRVLTPEGRGLRNAAVTLTGPDGQTRSAPTSSFSPYRFENIAVGHQYTIAVAAKNYRFSQRTHPVADGHFDLDFLSLN